MTRTLLFTAIYGLLCFSSNAFAPSHRIGRTFPIGEQCVNCAQINGRNAAVSAGSRNISVNPRAKNTELYVVAAPSVLGLAAITSSMSGGLFSGGLHAIAGPDHLAALLPQCLGQRWYRSGRVGALWGIGHGISAALLGIAAFCIKNTFASSINGPWRKVLSGASHITDIAVGISLVFIGAMGIKEAREWKHEIDGVQPQTLSSAATDAGMKWADSKAVVFNGLLHGLSLDGAPSLAPALAVATWGGNLAFLGSYALGTMMAMAVTTTLIGESTRKAGQVLKRPDIPQKLSMGSSILAIVIGVAWSGLALA